MSSSPNHTTTAQAPAQASTPTRHAPRKWGARRPNTPDVAMMANAKSGACAGCGNKTLLGTDDLCLSCALNAPRPTEPAAPYHCPRCSAASPYAGRRPKHRGGMGCRACSAVVDAIYSAQMQAYRPLAAAAYRPGVGGETKTRIIAEATRAGTEAWRAALDRYGVYPGAAEGGAL